MKKTRLFEIIREEIKSALNEKVNALVTTKKGETKTFDYETPQDKAEINKLKTDSNITGIETTSGQKIKEDQLNEMAKIDPELSGLMTKAADKYIEDNNVDVEELKSLLKPYLLLLQARDKEATKEFTTGEGEPLAKVLLDLRRLFTGDPTKPIYANRQDPEVNKLMIDREDELIDNQTNNFIYNYLGKINQQRGRKAGEKSVSSEKTPEKTSKETPEKTSKEAPKAKTGGTADKKDQLLADLKDVTERMAKVAKDLKAAAGTANEKKLIEKRRDLNIEKEEIQKKIDKLGFRK